MASKRRQYSQEDLNNALKFIENKEGSIREAAKKFNIPRSTLQFKTENPHVKPKSGPDPILSEGEERELSKFIKDLARQGFPLKKDDLLLCVQDFLNKNPRPNPFRNNKPGETWFKSFMKRNPNITYRTSEGVTNASSCVSVQDIRKWFSEIDQYFVENGLEDMLNDPTRIFNADETGFNICPKSGRVLAEKGSKNVYQIEKTSAKENITVMFTFSASGHVCYPMIIYPYKRIPDKVTISVPSGWGIGRSDTGWMTAGVFYDYIANCFNKELLDKNIQRPVILFVDGHKTHITIEVSELCKSLQIHLIALYPNATRILQPADVAAFRPIKVGWKKALHEWYAENNHQVFMTKENFAPLLKKVVSSCTKPETLINGFRVCGLHPFEPNNVDYSKCIPNAKSSETETTTLAPAPEGQFQLSYSDFCNIVGMSIISKCQRMFERQLNEQDVSDDFLTLYKLWQTFNRITEISTPLPVMENSCDEHVIRTTEKSDIILDERTGELKQTIDNTTEQKFSIVTENATNIDVPVNNRHDQQEIIHAQPGPSLQLHPNKIITVVSNEPLSDYLKKRTPNTPKRQGKRQIERLPFALTSDVYLEKMKTKQLKKKEEEEAKEQRKRLREEKKTQKENTVPKKTGNVAKNKIFSFKENKTSKCDKITCCDFCLSPLKKRIIECNQCQKKYHFNCIPSTHRVHVPEDNDDSFLCHFCYKENNTDSSEEEADDLCYNLYEEAKKQRY